MKIEAVLFDLFDTLVLIEGSENDNMETFYVPCLKKLHESLVKNGVAVTFENFQHAYFEVRDEFYAKSQKSLDEPHFNVRVAQTLQRLGYNFSVSDKVITEATKAFANQFILYVRLDKDTTDVLQRLNGKYKIGLVSNFAIPECCWELLEKYDLKRFFDAIVISGEINRRKPSPEIFEKALTILNVTPQETVFVGDTLNLDIKGAKDMGMKAILIKRRPVKDMGIVKPDAIIENLTELPSILQNC